MFGFRNDTPPRPPAPTHPKEKPVEIPKDNAPLEPQKPLTTAQYRTERRKKKHPFNFELDSQRRTKLRQIADSRGISMGATLRQLISTAHLMTVDRQPHCVDGRSCFMPHLHAQSTPPQIPPENTP